MAELPSGVPFLRACCPKPGESPGIVKEGKRDDRASNGAVVRTTVRWPLSDQLVCHPEGIPLPLVNWERFLRNDRADGGAVVCVLFSWLRPTNCSVILKGSLCHR